MTSPPTARGPLTRLLGRIGRLLAVADRVADWVPVVVLGGLALAAGVLWLSTRS